MTLSDMIQKIKMHPDYPSVGMILCHNGVVRSTSRDQRSVTGLEVSVDYDKLDTLIKKSRHLPGIVDIQVKIFDNQRLSIGDDVMYLVVAGDIRENVIHALSTTLNAIKTTVTRKTEFFVEENSAS
jgi:molybdopterin synthase catalytic subunit